MNLQANQDPDNSLDVLLQASVVAQRASGSAPSGSPYIVLTRVSYPRQIRKARQMFEREFVREALRRCDHNISLTARTIGMARRNLQYLLRRLRINVEQMKQRRE